jgi:hypothetical protein
MEAFIDHQVKLVQEEKRIDVEDTQKLLSSYSPIQLQKRGMALLGLRVTGKDIAKPAPTILITALLLCLLLILSHAYWSWWKKVMPIRRRGTQTVAAKRRTHVFN